MEVRRDVGESSCNFGDGTDQRVQSLMFMMMMMMMMMMMIKIQYWVGGVTLIMANTAEFRGKEPSGRTL